MRRNLKRYYGAGDLHFITCSCYRRQPLLGTPRRRDLLLTVLEQVRKRYQFVVAGYVVMPEHIHWSEKHPNDPAGEGKAWDAWDDAIEKEEQNSGERLNRMLANADFIRKEMLQLIPPQQQNMNDKRQEKEFAQTKRDPESLAKAARYLENLARRVPPPPK